MARDKNGRFLKGNIPFNLGNNTQPFTDEERRLRHNERSRQWIANNKDKRKKYYEENRDSYLKIGKNNSYLRKYGITLSEKLDRLKSQGYQCLICSRQINQYSGKVDHDHETGQIRGILCNFCNTALGSFQDDVQLLQNAIEYLKINVTKN